MEELDLDHLEAVITYVSMFGKEKELFVPTVIEFVSDRTIHDETNRLVLGLVKDFWDKNKKVPSVSECKIFLNTEDKVKRFKDFLITLKQVKLHEYDPKTLVKLTEEFFKQRIIKDLVDDAFIKSTNNEPVDVTEIYTKIEEAMSIHMVDDIGLSLFKDAEEYCEELINEEARISTGFDWLDLQLGGGLLTSGSCIYNFCAASNVGKSNFIKSLACNISKSGKHVLVVSLEMPRFIYANRFVAELADINISELKENADNIGSFLRSAPDKGYGDIVIKDYATGSLTPQALGAYVTRVEKHLGISFDVVFVDYPELLKSSKSFNSRHDLMVANLYVETRALSFAQQKPYVVVSQLNRDGFDKEKPSMANIGGAIGIAQCSDFCGFLYSNPEMKEINQIGMIVGKSRFGPVNKSKRFDVNEYTLKITESESNGEIILDVDDDLMSSTQEAEDFFTALINES